ncbi:MULTISPECIES: HAMP domain-containing sensor histidine kinase [unclassified Roseovarius]|uniref:sensor histidine kinase n=1 Tax=unclassified Roseovarius TaxID=2614913 RepID=UPI00273FAFC4|nr:MULTISPECIES: HAMP domain-containing sensor histidine kinase [unclassified Roseovarius]
MPLGNLTAGHPFKAAWRVLLVFLLCYAIAGYFLVSAVTNTLKTELEAQTKAESLLLQNIYQRDGKAGLLNALRDMERAVRPPEHMVSLFDENGITLTGPVSGVPDFVGVTHREVEKMTGGKIAGRYVLNVQKLAQMTLIVGRDARFIDTAGRRLIIGLALFGGVLSGMTLMLGLWASRASLARLSDMEKALFRVSEGDLAARLPVMARNDQFDRVSARMNHNLDRLERLVAGAKSTAAAIAHDLKTPLSHTQIALNEAADAVEAGRDPAPRIEAALHELQSLNTTFDTMLRISRIQAKTETSRFGQVDLGDIAAKVIEFMQPLAEERGQTLRLNAQEVSTFADAAMLQQALVNLVNNACTHTGRGATIVVEVAQDAQGPILSVSDDGPGIPEADRNKVLEPFVRLDQARTTPGSGLGLALAKAVADHHGGALELSDAKPGLRVELRLPNIKKV